MVEAWRWHGSPRQEANEHLQKADHLCQLNNSSVNGQLAQVMVCRIRQRKSPWLTFSFAKLAISS